MPSENRVDFAELALASKEGQNHYFSHLLPLFRIIRAYAVNFDLQL